MNDKELIEDAKKAQENAYAPYSNFMVGAALLSADGRVFTGVNVENASYGLTICAERTAVFKAVSDGAEKFAKIAIVSSSSPPAAPCGACRQVLNEFSPNLQVICANHKNEIKRFELSQLLPESFNLEKE
jgi:cytidine deaminase